MKIENKTLTKEDIGKSVIFVPPRANGDFTHKSCETGEISSWNDAYVFVRFNPPQAQACKPEWLHWNE